MAQTARVTISPPNMQTAEFLIVGTAPYVQNKFPQKVLNMLKAQQEAGSTAKSKRTREPKDFEEAYKGAQHLSKDGKHGIPAPAFRSAMIDACRLVGFKMTHAKLSVFAQHDFIDAEDGTPLIAIQGKPKKHQGSVRNKTGVVDIRVRPMWEEWSVKLRITFDGDQFTLKDVANLLSRAGLQVGIGEGRPNSPDSHGMGWGTFRIKEEA